MDTTSTPPCRQCLYKPVSKHEIHSLRAFEAKVSAIGQELSYVLQQPGDAALQMGFHGLQSCLALRNPLEDI